MIYPLLPAFLTGTLRAGPAFLGVVEGLAETVAAVVKVVSGRVSDRRPRRKPLVVAGYALSSLVRPLVALATLPGHVLAVRVLDRVGKGVRGAPRDALLAEVAPPSDRGRAFGFQRAMDHAGAMTGPLLATGRDARDERPAGRVRPRRGPRRPRRGDARPGGAGRPAPGGAALRRDAVPGRRPRAGARALPRGPRPVHAGQLLGRLPAAPGAGGGCRARPRPGAVGPAPPRQGGREHVGGRALRPGGTAPGDPPRLGRVRDRLRRLRLAELAARRSRASSRSTASSTPSPRAPSARSSPSSPGGRRGAGPSASFTP